MGILGNAVDFSDNSSSDSMVEGNTDRRRLMIAFDMRYESKHFELIGYKDLLYYIHFLMVILKKSIFNLLPRCVGFIMAKLVLRELMDASVFLKFKSFLNKVCFLVFYGEHLFLINQKRLYKFTCKYSFSSTILTWRFFRMCIYCFATEVKYRT